MLQEDKVTKERRIREKKLQLKDGTAVKGGLGVNGRELSKRVEVLNKAESVESEVEAKLREHLEESIILIHRS